MGRVFVVEDNAGLNEAITSYLEVDGHTVFPFDRLGGVLDAIRMARPDLIVLDVMLPDGDGFMFARRLRKESDVPILFLTARSSESDRITGFEIGADDYVVKPFSMRELVLRVRSVLARTSAQPQQDASRADVPTWTLRETRPGHEGWVDHQLVLDDGKHAAMHDGNDVRLTATEWKILQFLAEREGRVVTREQLLGQCLDYLAEGSERSINTHMKNIRAKLDAVEWVETVRGFGYRFVGKAAMQ